MELIGHNKSKKLKIHLIGIGGVSMSGIAEILQSLGHEITGSDSSNSLFIDKLKLKGITVENVHKKENISNQDLVCYSAAISKNNPEIVEAVRKNIPIIERCFLLSKIIKMYKTPISIAGSHGKTTTTAMITSILTKAQKKPTALIGGYYEEINGNVLIGDKEYLVYEACEYVESFLQLPSYASVIINIDADHLDYYRDLNHIILSFKKFANLCSDFLLLNADDKNSETLIETSNDERLVTFGIEDKKCDFCAKDIEIFDNKTQFVLFHREKKMAKIKIASPCRHNIINALAAFSLCYKIGIKIEDIEKGLENFKGIQRRFQILGKFRGTTIIDDYGHHPAEISSTLKTISQMGFNKVFCIFQSHTYTRTAALLDELADSLKIADKVIVTKIYAAREENKIGVYPEDISNKIDGALTINDFCDIVKYLKLNVKAGDVVVTMGAGDVNLVGEMLLKEQI